MNRTVDRPLQELRRGVEGLSPDAEKHEFFFDIEPVSWVLISKLHINVVSEAKKLADNDYDYDGELPTATLETPS